MVSLSAVEQSLVNIVGEQLEDLMVVNVPSSLKGELLILFYTGNIEASDLSSLLKESNLNKFMLPKRIEKMDALPRLGSGKKNYMEAKKIALETS